MMAQHAAGRPPSMKAFERIGRGSIVLALLLAVTGTASAGWKEYATAHKWDSSDVDGNGALDCPAGSYNGSPAVFTNKPPGGWFEYRFANHPNPALDLNSPFVDITRRCPRTFNEYSENHHHGVRNVRLATWLNRVYAVYDTYSGYHGGDRIKLQLNPELITNTVGPPYTLLHLWRNPRGYVDVDHHSPEWVGPEDCTTLGLPPGVIDQDWREHWGASHTGTLCHPPALTETADPDIAIAPASPDESAHEEFHTLARAGLRPAEGEAFIVWIERYVDGKFSLGPGPMGEARWMYGFDPNYYAPPGRDPSVPGPNFPFDDTFKVHVDMVETGELNEFHVFGGHGHGSPAHTPLTGSDGLANPLVDAYSPRVTTYFDRHHPHRLPVGGGNGVLVAYAEGAGSAANHYFIKARKWDGGTQWSPAGNILGWRTCNWRTVSSGRASGGKK